MKKNYKDIHVIRLFACLAILLYHFQIIKGGYLAVCVFFVLSSYLSCLSAFKKEKFSIKSYYVNRFLKIYVPLVLVVFITIATVSLVSNITWMNLKPETTSVLFGYNNFWQLIANLDYFKGHIQSPFIHFWYISILLQFDIVFPFLFLLLRKIGNQFQKIIPSIITFLGAIGGTIYFIIMNQEHMMSTYYHTFTRLFSLLFGLSLGFTHTYYKTFIPKFLKEKTREKMILYLYLFLLCVLFLFVDSNSIYYVPSMILVTLITCRFLDYATIVENENSSKFQSIIETFSKISYEIYLFQYPVIFIFQSINIPELYKIPIMSICILLLSFLLHFTVSIKTKKFQFLRYITISIVLCISLYGGYQYWNSKNYTKEMKQLEKQLSKNETIVIQKQEEYLKHLKQEESNWMTVLKELETNENEIQTLVTQLPVVGIGDSVMLGAVLNLYETFPNGYFDAKISRTAWVVKGILQDLKKKNMLGETIIINLGANGDCSLSCKQEIMQECENRDVFWVNVTNDENVHINKKLLTFSNDYQNLHIIDWNAISTGHPEYFFADGIHLTEVGKKEYSSTIYNAIYQVYLEKYNIKKEEVLKKHEEEQKSKISFYGNDLLLGIFEELQSNFKEANFVINKDFNYESFKEEITKKIQNKTLTHKIVFAFNSKMALSSSQLQELIELCNGHQIYILAMDSDISNFANQNVTILNFYKELKNHNDYVMVDGIHLTEKGNQALTKLLKKTIKEKNF